MPKKLKKTKRPLTPEQRRARKKRKEETMTIFINGKQKRVPRLPKPGDEGTDEWLIANADPVFLHQIERWDLIDAPGRPDPERDDNDIRFEQLSTMTQLAFDFSQDPPSSSDADGLLTWRTERRVALEEMARQQCLPLDHKVRVDFENGPSLEGILLLCEEELFHPTKRIPDLHLRIGKASFHANEISSCIRLD